MTVAVSASISSNSRSASPAWPFRAGFEVVAERDEDEDQRGGIEVDAPGDESGQHGDRVAVGRRGTECDQHVHVGPPILHERAVGVDVERSPQHDLDRRRQQELDPAEFDAEHRVGHESAAEQEFVGEEDEHRCRQHGTEERESELFADLALAGGIAGVGVAAAALVALLLPDWLVAGVLDGVVEQIDIGSSWVVSNLCLVGGVVHVRLNDAGQRFQCLGVGVGAVRTRHIRDTDARRL
jgi:hypothetical protein